MMELQTNSMTVPSYSKSKTKRSESPKMIFKENMPIRAPPGLELLENEPAKIPTEKKPCKLSLVDLCGPTEDTQPLASPPGLEDVAPPPGLEFMKNMSNAEKGMESDDTLSTTGSGRQLSENEESASDGEKPAKQTLCLGSLVLAERNELKASAKMFTPMLSATGPATDEIQRTPLRTKLRTRADLFVPTQAAPTQSNNGYPFLPSSAVKETWQKWHMRNAMFGGQMDGVSSYDTSVGSYSENTEAWTSSYENAQFENMTDSYENMGEWYSEDKWEYEA